CNGVVDRPQHDVILLHSHSAAARLVRARIVILGCLVLLLRRGCADVRPVLGVAGGGAVWCAGLQDRSYGFAGSQVGRVCDVDEVAGVERYSVAYVVYSEEGLGRGAALQAVQLVALLDQQVGQIAAVLAGDARDQGSPRAQLATRARVRARHQSSVSRSVSSS